MACENLSTNQLLALVAANIAPLVRCSDGRWRASWRNFPDSGVAETEVRFLMQERLVECAGNTAIVTGRGRQLIESCQSRSPSFAALPAMTGTEAAHRSLQ